MACFISVRKLVNDSDLGSFARAAYSYALYFNADRKHLLMIFQSPKDEKSLELRRLVEKEEYRFSGTIYGDSDIDCFAYFLAMYEFFVEFLTPNE